MHDFGCKKSRDMYYPEPAKGIKHFKEEEGGRKIMCEAVEKYAERRRIDALYEVVKNLMESMKWNAEQAMSAMQISDKDKSILLKRL